MLNRRQARVEEHWKHVERDSLFERRYKYIDLNENRKDKVMEKSTGKCYWRAEDVERLKKNITRPISEIVAILKNRFTWDQVEKKKQELLNKPNKKPRTLISDELFLKICDTCEMSTAAALNELKGSYSCKDNTIIWTRSLVRKELKGIKSKMSERLYNLLSEWYQEKYGKPMEPRGSNIEMVKFSDSRKGRIPSKPAVEDSVKIEEPDCTTQEPNYDTSEPKESEIDNTIYYVVRLGSKFISEPNEDKSFVEGVLSVYRKLGMIDAFIENLKVTK